MAKLNNKTKKIDLGICKDAKMLFSNERSGHVGYLQYGSPRFENDNVCGAQLWSKARLKDEYYLGNEEDVLLSLVNKELSILNLNVISVLELGPGDNNALSSKTIPLIKSLKAEKYIAIDMEETYAQGASDFISQKCRINSQYIISNFLNNTLYKRHSNALLFMAGSTISNINVSIDSKNVLPHLTSELISLRAYVDDESYFLVGFDSNQDKDSLDTAYQTNEHARLIEDIMWRIQRDTDFTLEPEKFKYEGIWIAEEHRYAHCVRCTSSTKVIIDNNVTLLDKGHTLLLENSYKYPVSMFSKAAESAGWIVKYTWSLTGRTQYMLLKAS